jgi:hypothetical protein
MWLPDHGPCRWGDSCQGMPCGSNRTAANTGMFASRHATQRCPQPIRPGPENIGVNRRLGLRRGATAGHQGVDDILDVEHAIADFAPLPERPVASVPAGVPSLSSRSQASTASGTFHAGPSRTACRSTHPVPVTLVSRGPMGRPVLRVGARRADRRTVGGTGHGARRRGASVRACATDRWRRISAPLQRGCGL